MSGWGNRDVRHVLAIYGYNALGATNTSFYYTETSGTAAGYYGSYRQSMPMEQLWQHVSRNNSQVW